MSFSARSAAPITRKQLLAASAASQTSDDWIVRTDAGAIVMRPFAAIKDETYRLYQKVES